MMTVQQKKEAQAAREAKQKKDFEVGSCTSEVLLLLFLASAHMVF